MMEFLFGFFTAAVVFTFIGYVLGRQAGYVFASKEFSKASDEALEDFKQAALSLERGYNESIRRLENEINR